MRSSVSPVVIENRPGAAGTLERGRRPRRQTAYTLGIQ